MNLTNINDLKIGQRVWWFSKYGELKGGDKGCIITELKPNYIECGNTYDEVSLDIEEIQEYDYDSVKVKENKKNGCSQYKLINKRKVDKSVIRHYGICAKQTMIHLSKPKQSEFVSNEVEFESDCECGGTIYGSGFEDNNGEMVSFNYQECDSCGWNQSS